ncbi:MAG: prolipoprotein diacylglyceryl transferase, partial [Campylobacterales bacterium]|nr:prolipoprotein diacylglyceryl transferase [Campylobacterales bacterium]
MEYWNYIYSNFNPVAFELFNFKVHWYGLMYILALLSALMVAKWIVKKDNLNISETLLDNYFIWVEIGVILGARIGYILFYDPNKAYYLLNPWQMFNPFINGEFVGIRGMSFHGALIGFLLSTILFSKKYNISFWYLMDLVALSVPLGYVFGRVGNFLNQELIGRETTSSFGIYVDGILRHPSQLYEAFLEGIVIFIIIFLYRKHKKFVGELACLYGMLYGLARFVAEFFREPDFHLGYICCDLSMGQLLSILMIVISALL